MFNAITAAEDIKLFLEKTNWLHDGYIIGVQYTNNSITKIENGYCFLPDQRKLTLQILVTSIWDAVVEIEFEGLWEWQIKDDQGDITDTTVMFKKFRNISKQNLIVWSDDISTDMDEIKKGSYVIASSMRWRIVE